MTTTRSARPWKRLQAQVFAEESHCWLCGEYVDQTLEPNDLRARSVDHRRPVALDGDVYDRANLRLAHRQCNSERGIHPPTPLAVPHTREW